MSASARPHLTLLTDEHAPAWYAPAEQGAHATSPWTDLSPAGDASWRLEALCAETDPEAFFLEFALANDERFGIWGGLSERERRRLRLQQRTDLSA